LTGVKNLYTDQFRQGPEPNIIPVGGFDPALVTELDHDGLLNPMVEETLHPTATGLEGFSFGAGPDRSAQSGPEIKTGPEGPDRTNNLGRTGATF
jgi:hypothetical protein